MAELNMMAVIAAAVVNIVLGFLWYGPLFGKEWMKLMGITEKMKKEGMKRPMGKTYAVMAVSALIMSYVLGNFVDYVGATTFGAGIMLGATLWIGFFATSMVGSVLWENKPVKLYMLNTLYYLVALSLMAGIQAVWV